MTRRYTKILMGMILDGLLDKDQVLLACVNYMSEADVKDMMYANEFVMQLTEVGDEDGS